MPLQPVLTVISVAATIIEKMRVFILCSLICIASVFGDLYHETEQNYVAACGVQTQQRVFSATM